MQTRVLRVLMEDLVDNMGRVSIKDKVEPTTARDLKLLHMQTRVLRVLVEDLEDNMDRVSIKDKVPTQVNKDSNSNRLSTSMRSTGVLEELQVRFLV